MKFWIFKHYSWVLPIILILVIFSAHVAEITIDFKFISTILGAFLSSVYFLQKQKLEEIRLFREIFSECNKRYDDLNDKINNIMRGDSDIDLSDEEENLLDDYFNLCGEEYLYFKQGYIYSDVWFAWMNGMQSILKDKRIGKHWHKEKETGSFYGLPL